METLGMIGAGRMGKGIVKNLLRAGYPFIVHTRDADPKNPGVAELMHWGAVITGKVEELFEKADILMTCLPTSREVEDIYISGKGILIFGNTPVKIAVDFTTAKPDSTKKINEKLKKVGITFLDAPMTGGPQQADEAKLSLAVGGEKSVFLQMKPLFEKIAANIIYAGETGSGNVLKIVNNFMGILNRCTTSAVCLLVEKQKIPLSVLADFIRVSGGYSRGFDAQCQYIAADEKKADFALALALKDLRYAKELFSGNRVSFEILDELVSLFTLADESGLGRKDMGAIVEYLKAR